MPDSIVLRFWWVELGFFQKTDEIPSVIPMKHVLHFRGFSSLIALSISFQSKQHDSYHVRAFSAADIATILYVCLKK